MGKEVVPKKGCSQKKKKVKKKKLKIEILNVLWDACAWIHTYQQSKNLATQDHLFNVGLQNITLFLGLLDLLGQFVSNLVQLLLQGLVGTLQLSQFLQCYRDNLVSFFAAPQKCWSQQGNTEDQLLSHLLTVSLLVLELLLQSSSAALSVVPLTVHLICHLLELLLKWWTLKKSSLIWFLYFVTPSALWQICASSSKSQKNKNGKYRCVLPLFQLAAVVLWPESVHVWSWSGLCPVHSTLCGPGSAEFVAPAAWRPDCEFLSRE